MSTADSALPFGVYETPITRRISERLTETQKLSPDSVAEIKSLDDEEVKRRYTDALAREFSLRFEAKLSSLNEEKERIALINSMAALLDTDSSVDSEQLLTSIRPTSLIQAPQLPEQPLSSLALLTNAKNESNMDLEIRRELETADSVDLLCAFIKTGGLRVLDEPLLKLRDRGVPLRIITTTYCGATDKEAIDRLVEKYGAEIKISYETNMTRLHAKAWLFKRNSGFDTAYIGSSNLSASALVNGMEWNVRTSSGKSPEIVSKFIATFDSYWADKHFVSYDPRTDGQELEYALKRDRFASGGSDELAISGLEVKPYPYQQDMLESLQAEREQHNRHRNLLVAATGTGKTVVAALDYRNMCDALGRRPRLLFIAHRKEILQQALRTFREVLSDGNFGELLVDGVLPKEWTHVFASIQSLNTSRMEALGKDHFEFIIIDEFHHAQAISYRKVMDYFEPQELLGLTATPERGDGINVKEFFDYRVAHELRIWDALSLQLLAPMQYFGVNDDTDLQSVAWDKRKHEYAVSALNELYVARGEKRARLILQSLNNYAFGLSGVKALGFCVSVEHATFMAAYFSKQGVPAAVLSGQDNATTRRNRLDDLKTGRIKVIFSVDLFNEGLDIPEINTVLLLRPTQSPVLFLQQIGRGLRLYQGKESCLILDFVGLHSQEFDMESRFRALTGFTGKELVDQAENDFPAIPAGSSIILDKLTKEQVLKNLKQVTRTTSKRMISLTGEIGSTSLRKFIDSTGIPVMDVYRPKDYSWNFYLGQADLADKADPRKDLLLNRVKSFLHIDDYQRANAYRDIIASTANTIGSLPLDLQPYAKMLILNIWANRPQKVIPATFDKALEEIHTHRAFCKELSELLEIQVEDSKVNPAPLKGDLGNTVLLSHAQYSLAELMAVLEDGEELPIMAKLPREGVRKLNNFNADLFLVTLQKSDKHFNEKTSYKDYPISPDLFHWESQSRTAIKSPTAQRYIHHKELDHSLLLAVRNANKNEVGLAESFTLLGQVDYVSHKNEKPIQFELALQRSMPQHLFIQGRAVV
ncbi:DUF3427 domain-containing protein [Corynebacterium diphtheriae]